MTKKDFELIAAILDNGLIVAPSSMAETAREQRDEYARRFADRLAEENPRFNRARFLRACGCRA